jgi:hypothetical protein
MQRRDYAGRNDLIAMQLAVQRTWTPESRWHIGDLAWGRNNIPNREPTWHTSLWEDDDRVMAWGWVTSPGNLDLYVDPAHIELAADVLALRDAGAIRAVVYPRGDDAYPVARRLYFGLGFRPVARTITYGR